MLFIVAFKCCRRSSL